VAAELEGIRGSRWESGFRRADFWRDAPDAAVEHLLDAARLHRCRKGEVLFREGSVSDRLIVVLHGYARGVHYETTGHVVLLEVLSAGHVVGTISAFAGAPFEGDVEAGPATTVAILPASVLEDVICSYPEVAMPVVRSMARRWVAVVAASKRNATSVPGRVARYLSELPRTQTGPNTYRVELPTKRVELAATLATSPETLSRAFHRLRDEGLIADAGRSVGVLDATRLRVVAEGDAHAE
jgi:CRP-like cAMP-binding protein